MRLTCKLFAIKQIISVLSRYLDIECISKDFDKFNFIISCFEFRIEPISENDASHPISFKCGQKGYKNSHLAFFSKDKSKALIHSANAVRTKDLDKLNLVIVVWLYVQGSPSCHKKILQVSISSTLNVQIFRTNFISAAFLRTYIEKKLPK